jgi:hypothetical protein
MWICESFMLTQFCELDVSIGKRPAPVEHKSYWTFIIALYKQKGQISF